MTGTLAQPCQRLAAVKEGEWEGSWTSSWKGDNEYLRLPERYDCLYLQRGPADCHASFYRSQHYKTLGVPMEKTLPESVSGLSLGGLRVDGLEAMFADAAGRGSESTVYDSEGYPVESDGESDGDNDVSSSIAAATADLIAACAVKAEKQLQMKKALRDMIQPNVGVGSGRAARVMRVKAAAGRRKLGEENLVGSTKRNEMEAEQRERVAFAQEDLTSALAADYSIKTKNAAQEELDHLVRQVSRLQRMCRNWKAIKLKRLQVEKEEREHQEEQIVDTKRKWYALRAPQPVRLCCKFEEEVEIEIENVTIQKTIKKKEIERINEWTGQAARNKPVYESEVEAQNSDISFMRYDNDDDVDQMLDDDGPTYTRCVSVPEGGTMDDEDEYLNHDSWGRRPTSPYFSYVDVVFEQSEDTANAMVNDATFAPEIAIWTPRLRTCSRTARLTAPGHESGQQMPVSAHGQKLKELLEHDIKGEQASQQTSSPASSALRLSVRSNAVVTMAEVMAVKEETLQAQVVEIEAQIKSRGSSRSTSPTLPASRPESAATRPVLVPAARSPSPVTRPPSAATRPPSAATGPPSAATRPPSAAIRPPSAATRPPSAAIRPPSAATRPPSAATRLTSAATRADSPPTLCPGQQPELPRLSRPQSSTSLSAVVDLVRSSTFAYQQSSASQANASVVDSSVPRPPPTFHEQAVRMIRDHLLYEPAIGASHSGIRDVVRDVYIQNCKEMSVKPNSLALARINVEIMPNKCPHIYDFSGSNVGDRGVVCLLLALAHDPHCREVSLHACGLRGASSASVATFVELSHRLERLDLSKNDLSFEAGGLILEALEMRIRRQNIIDNPRLRGNAAAREDSAAALMWWMARAGLGNYSEDLLVSGYDDMRLVRDIEADVMQDLISDLAMPDEDAVLFRKAVKQVQDPAALVKRARSPKGRCNQLAVDLGETPLAWGRGGATVGPPCGTLWASAVGRSSSTKRRQAPSDYEKLRGRLDRTQHVMYDGRDHEPPREDPTTGGPSREAAVLSEDPDAAADDILSLMRQNSMSSGKPGSATSRKFSIQSTRPPSAIHSTRPPSAMDSTRPPSPMGSTRPPSAIHSTRPPSAIQSTRPPSALQSTRPASAVGPGLSPIPPPPESARSSPTPGANLPPI